MWTGAKGFYKVEPVVADGGEVILYAPHITQISAMHPEIEEIGYHCRDYFVQQWDRFRHLHWGVLAHSTHLRGAGTYDAEHGRAVPASPSPWRPASPRTSSARANLDYLDPAAVDLEAYGRRPGHARRAPRPARSSSACAEPSTPRTTSRTGSTIGEPVRGCAPSTIASRCLVAVAPSVCSGEATVVSPGVISSAATMLSKPTTLTSRGTAHPAGTEPADEADRHLVVVGDHGARTRARRPPPRRACRRARPA